MGLKDDILTPSMLNIGDTPVTIKNSSNIGQTIPDKRLSRESFHEKYVKRAATMLKTMAGLGGSSKTLKFDQTITSAED